MSSRTNRLTRLAATAAMLAASIVATPATSAAEEAGTTCYKVIERTTITVRVGDQVVSTTVIERVIDSYCVTTS